MIVPGSSSQSLAAALAAELDEPLASVEVERFPDGEFLTRVSATGDRAIVVTATDSATAHLEVLQLQDAVSEAAEVVTILPYMGYARQDQSFQDGDPVSARAVARAISTGCDRVLTVNPHEEHVCGFFDVPAGAVDAAARLAVPLPDDLADPVFIAPDAGATELAGAVREEYGRGETDHFEKTRRSATEVEVTPSAVDVSGRPVVLVDDIVTTGRTMSAAIEHVHDRGASRVVVTCVHPMLAGGARTRLARAGVEAIYGTDTLERSVSAVTVAPTLAAQL